MYKDHSDQLHSVKRRRSQEQDGASVVPTSSPLKVKDHLLRNQDFDLFGPTQPPCNQILLIKTHFALELTK